MIDQLLSGVPLSLLIKGGKAVVDRVLKASDAERMLWILSNEFGEQVGFDRKAMFSWLDDEEFGDAVEGMIDGALSAGRGEELLTELLIPRLVNTPSAERQDLAAKMARSMRMLTPWVIDAPKRASVHLSNKLDQNHGEVMEELRALGSDKSTDLSAVANGALLRGPLRDIGVEQKATEARSLANDGKHLDAAALMAEIAAALESAGLSPVAERYAAIAADYFRTAGESGKAVNLLLPVAEAQVSRGSSFATLTTRKLHGDLPVEERWRTEALAARVRFGPDPESAHAALKNAVDATADAPDRATHLRNYVDLLALSGDHAEIVAILGERTGAPRDAGELSLMLDLLDARREVGDEAHETEWAEVLGWADREDDRTLAGIAWQRRGLDLAHRADVTRSQDAYRRAIAAWSETRGYDEQVAEAFYSMQAASMLNGLLFPPDEELRGLASEMRGSVATPVGRAEELARQGMALRIGGKPREALERYGAALGIHRRTGSLQGIITTRDLIAELYVSVGQPAKGMANYIARGGAREAVGATAGVPGAAIAAELRFGKAIWERTAAMAVIAASGDRMPVDRLAELTSVVQEAASEPIQSMVFPQPGYHGRMARSRIAVALEEDVRAEVWPGVLEDVRSPHIEISRAAGQALTWGAGLEQVDPMEGLIDAFLEDPYNRHISEELLGEGISENAALRDKVVVAAKAEVVPALEVLVLGEAIDDDPELIAAADRVATRLKDASNLKKVDGGTSIDIGVDYARDGTAARIAPEDSRRAAIERLVELTQAAGDSEMNRASAVHALFNISPAIPGDQVDGVTRSLVTLATGDYPLSEVDRSFGGPLDAFRVRITTDGALWSAALRATARILRDHPEGEREAIESAIVTTFVSAPPIALAAAIDALGDLIEIPMPMSIDALLAHESPDVRAAAMRCWAARNESELPSSRTLEALKRDPSLGVRHILTALAGERGDHAVLQEMRNDEHAVIRGLAEQKLKSADALGLRAKPGSKPPV